MKGTIFNIQKFSITDGVGIRTLIFMKGCPLHCLWCSNPESQKFLPEIMDVKSNCVACGKCVGVCPEGAVDVMSFDIDRDKCTVCGLCAEQCYAAAKKITGQEYTVEDILEIIEKDRVFYRNSGGGVTVGGGEPAAQSEFVAELLGACRSSHIHTAIETCGAAPWERFRTIAENADQIFYDLKAMDSDLHKRLTGVGNEQILDTASRMTELQKEIIFRIPLVPGLNSDEDNLKETARFVRTLEGKGSDISIELLAYHNYGRDKYRWLDRKYPCPDITKPSDEEMEGYKDLIRTEGVKVI